MKLIINADDFGISENVNNAILQSFQENLISSTTVMTNMPDSQQAYEMISDQNLHCRVGIHLNLTEGYPITKRMSLCKRFCDDNGKFRSQRDTLFWLDKEESETVYDEMQAQLNRLYDQNITPTHIDSHHHYHTEWAIGKQVLRLAYRNKIKAIRLTRNCGNGISKVKRIYKGIYNFNLAIREFSKVQYFGSVTDITTINKSGPYSVEIMVHPGFNEMGKLVDLFTGEELHSSIQGVKTLTPGSKVSAY